METPEPVSTATSTPRMSEAAGACTKWLRQFARAYKTSRLYASENPIVEQSREQVWRQLSDHLERFGPWTLRFTSSQILLGRECVVRARSDVRAEDGGGRAGEEQLPAFFYGDGIRSIRFEPGLPRSEFDALLDAMRAAGAGKGRHEDLVTLLWQANLSNIRVTSAPLEQTIYQLSGPLARGGKGAGQAPTHVVAPTGSELRADIGQTSSGQGLHRDRFDDRPLPDQRGDVLVTYTLLSAGYEASRARVVEEWEAESGIDETETALAFLRQMIEIQGDDETAATVAHLLVSWVVRSLSEGAWDDGYQALAFLREIDPDSDRWSDSLAKALSEIDATHFAARLDAFENDQLSSLVAFVLEVGHPAIDLTCQVMAFARRASVRAACGVALATLCSDCPERLTPYTRDSRWYVVRNAVYVLGMIGGAGISSMLRETLDHSDERVVKEAILALARVPRRESMPILLGLVDHPDPKVVSMALGVLCRERNSAVSEAILKRITASSFERASEEVQHRLFSALADIGGDEAVPALSRLVLRAGFFARRSFARSAAAQTLARIGTPRALETLELGLKSRHEAVRASCREALEGRTP